MELGSLVKKIMCLPDISREKLLSCIKLSNTSKVSPAGAVLIVMHLLESLGLCRKIDEILEETTTTIAYLKQQYKRSILKGTLPPIPSSGVILCLLVADMVARPKHIIRIYQVEEMASKWKTATTLGICPSILNDDRILRAMSALGTTAESMKQILCQLAIETAERFHVPLNRFFLDTTLLELDGAFAKASKVSPGRGNRSFSQLVMSLAVASGSRLPVAFGVYSGNTFDAHVLPDAFHAIQQVASPGPIELVMDRIFPTPENILFLQQQDHECLWLSPLKTALAGKPFRDLVVDIEENNRWQAISYRSQKEIQAKEEPPMSIYETNWKLVHVEKPPLAEGKIRREKNSIKRTAIPVRCVVYRHTKKAKHESERRRKKQQELEVTLNELKTKLNKRNLTEQVACEKAIKKLCESYAAVKKFVKIVLTTTGEKENIMVLHWIWDEVALECEEKTDGVFALITNYPIDKVNANQLLAIYRSRNEVEVDFRDMKGLLNLEQVFLQLPERIDCYLFLKVLAYFVLALLRWTAEEKKFAKTTEKKIQDTLGDMFISETSIEPLAISSYAVGSDSLFTQWIRDEFDLPNPYEVIEELNSDAELRIDAAISEWTKKNE